MCEILTLFNASYPTMSWALFYVNYSGLCIFGLDKWYLCSHHDYTKMSINSMILIYLQRLWQCSMLALFAHSFFFILHSYSTMKLISNPVDQDIISLLRSKKTMHIIASRIDMCIFAVSCIEYMHNLKVLLYVGGCPRKCLSIAERYVVWLVTSELTSTAVEAAKAITV
jgi:hypothetical protein